MGLMCHLAMTAKCGWHGRSTKEGILTLLEEALENLHRGSDAPNSFIHSMKNHVLNTNDVLGTGLMLKDSDEQAHSSSPQGSHLV